MQINACRQCPTRRQCLAAGLDDAALDTLAGCVAPGSPLKRGEDYVPVPMSRTDLADYLGMTLECLSRVLARFTRWSGERHPERYHLP